MSSSVLISSNVPFGTGGGGGSGFSAGGDLSGSSSSQQVNDLTGSGGIVTVRGTAVLNFPTSLNLMLNGSSVLSGQAGGDVTILQTPLFQTGAPLIKLDANAGIAYIAGNNTANGISFTQYGSGIFTTPALSINPNATGATTIAFASTVTVPLITQYATTSATGQNLTLAPQASTNTDAASGSVVVSLGANAGAGVATQPGLVVSQAGNGTIARISGLDGTASGFATLYTNGATGNNYTMVTTSTELAFQFPTGGNFYLGSPTTILAHTTESGIQFFNAGTLALGGGVDVIGIGNVSVAPTTTPTGGGILYVQAGALMYMGSSGTITPLAPA